MSNNTHSGGRKEKSKSNHFPAVGKWQKKQQLHLPWDALPAGLRADKGTALGGGEKGGL